MAAVPLLERCAPDVWSNPVGLLNGSSVVVFIRPATRILHIDLAAFVERLTGVRAGRRVQNIVRLRPPVAGSVAGAVIGALIAQAPAPFHVTPRGYIGPKLLATILLDKFGQHLPLNRQSQRFKAEGIDLSVSTLADQVGAGVFAAMPLYRLIVAHVLAAERLHGDDTTIPILAHGKTATGRIWTYVRDDRPFAGPAPPAALFYASRDRRGEHPARHLATFTGILQADAYSSFNALYDARHGLQPVKPAYCWAHSRRLFFELADIAKNARLGGSAMAISPIALEAVRRIDALFDIERDINGGTVEERLGVRRERSVPLLKDLQI